MAHRRRPHHPNDEEDEDGVGGVEGGGEAGGRRSGADEEEEEEEEEEDMLSAWTADTSMLADHDRNTKYEAVLRRLAPGKRVLDIGTGTGLLAMMAARHRASSVVACEVYQPMAEIAQQTLQRNGLQHSIKLVPKESSELMLEGDLDGLRVDLIVSEIVDSELLGEGILPSLRDAVRRLGTDSCVCIPSRATVHCQLVQSNLLRSWVDLKPCSIAGIPIFDETTREWVNPSLKHEVHVGRLTPQLDRVSEPFQAATIDLTRVPDEEAISTNVTAVTVPRGARVDGLVMWWTMVLADDIAIDTRPPWLFGPQLHQQERGAKTGQQGKEGETQEEEENRDEKRRQKLTEHLHQQEQQEGEQIEADKSSKEQKQSEVDGGMVERGSEHTDATHVWREHWLPMVYNFNPPIITAAHSEAINHHQEEAPHRSSSGSGDADDAAARHLTNEGSRPQEHDQLGSHAYHPCKSDEAIVHVAMSYDDYSIAFAASLDSSSPNLRPSRLSAAGPALPRDRIAMLNSRPRMSRIHAALRSLALDLTCSRIVGFGSVNVAAVAACHVFPSAQVHVVEHKHTAPVLKAAAAREGLSLSVHTEARALDSAPIDLVVAEPFYLDATEPWQAGVRFAHDLLHLRASGSPPAAVFPARVALCCALVQFEHLHTIRHRVQQACGFDMSAFDAAVCRPGTFSSIQSLWEYEHTLLCEPREAIVLDFARIASGHAAQDMSAASTVDVPLHLTHTGTCHAIIVFARTYFTSEAWEDGYTLGGAYSPFKQGVFLLDASQPCTGKRGHVVTVRVSLRPSEHGASVKADILASTAT